MKKYQKRCLAKSPWKITIPFIGGLSEERALSQLNFAMSLVVIGRFPIGIKTEIRYLIICASHNFMM